MRIQIDTAFDFRSDTRPGKDPDAFSPTLRRYHKWLWSKPLPSGVVFALDDSAPHYLHHRSEVGEFFLSSDAVIPAFSRERRISNIINQIPPEEQERYCQVDEKLVDQPPRCWARARHEPAMLGIRNGRQPQLDNTQRIAFTIQTGPGDRPPACASRIPNSLAESRIEATLRRAQRSRSRSARRNLEGRYSCLRTSIPAD